VPFEDAPMSDSPWPSAPGRGHALSLKVGLLVAGLLGLFAILTATFGIEFFSEELRRETVRRGRGIASSLANSLVEITAAHQDAAVRRAIEEVQEDASLVYVEVVNPDGTLFAHTHEGEPPDRPAEARTESRQVRDEEVGGRKVIDVPEKMITGHVVHVGLDRSALETMIFRARMTVIGVTAVVVVLAWLAAVWLVQPYVRDLAETNRRLASNVEKLREAQTRMRAELAARERAEVELQKAKDQADAASRSKSAFLANMSHEIRTPLNGVLGMIDLALGTALTPEQKEYLQTARLSADALLGVINDILDFSKIEAGMLDLDRIDLPLRDTLIDALKPLGLRAHERGLELACRVVPEVPDGLRGDPGRLRQVIVNLAGNAVKFTERGEVVLEVEPAGEAGEGADSCLLHFSVRDTGVGIAPEKLGHIFEPFTQADGSMTRKYGGTGLGLTISRKLVELMGGRCWAESTPGRGSTFHFTARFGRSPAAPARPGPEAGDRLKGLPVLVVDDNATNRRILHEMLAGWGMRPMTAAGAEEAMEVLGRAADAGAPIPVVLLDLMMPGEEGLSLAVRIKTDARLAGARLVILSSAGRLSEVAGELAAGVLRCLVKPVRPSELLDALLLALDETPPVAPSALAPEKKGPEEKTVPPLRILLAEDSPVNQRLAVRLLEKRGHTVVVAHNGREAVAALEEGEPFDLVLMDVQMPEMDGFEATRVIREREEGTDRHVPIVAMTASAMKGDREACLSAGMDSYLAKPITAEGLYRSVAETVTRSPCHRVIFPDESDL
jgi:signal transduction histidine kinase/CheY-like chemotaxis protein